MRILVTNDDGIFSEGLRLLAEAMEEIGEVTVVAPDREQSASGHSLTLHRPLRLRRVAPHRYTVDGTPTDCVNLAVQGLLKEAPPDLVVSGINFGLNLGQDVTYSGTVSAAFEANLHHLPAIAFSQEVAEGYSFATAAAYARRFVATVLESELPKDLLLNVNFPVGEIRGLRWTKLGTRRYHQTIVEKRDPRGRKYYWIGGTPEWSEESGTDCSALSSSYVSVTPLHLDLTDYRGFERHSALGQRLAALDSES